MQIEIGDNPLTLAQLAAVSQAPVTVSCSQDTLRRVQAAEQAVQRALAANQTIYGVNTGFGKLAEVKIPEQDLTTLQTKLLLSHAAGVGEALPDDIVRLLMLLKAHSLAQGYSGIRAATLQLLIFLLNNNIYPVIPSQGSLGASGDLAPLAHVGLVLIGLGQVRYQDKLYSGAEILRKFDQQSLQLAAKEGLALINGTQLSLALALSGLFNCERVFRTAVVAGAMALEAARGNLEPFDLRLHKLRPFAGQQRLAKCYLDLLAGSKMRSKHGRGIRVQDPYSLRCQPQVMGACWDQIQFVAQQLLIEVNSVTDNPLVFAAANAATHADTDSILSGGNFHAQPIAFAADNLALALAEIGSLSERRTALLLDTNISQLPPFLVRDSGLNSGFMAAQYTAAALVAENKLLAVPASVDSIPTSANQEDHVSMAPYAGRRLQQITANLTNIVAIELLVAAQGISLQQPLITSPPLQQVLVQIRALVPEYQQDRYMAGDIQLVREMVISGKFGEPCPEYCNFWS